MILILSAVDLSATLDMISLRGLSVNMNQIISKITGGILSFGSLSL